MGVYASDRYAPPTPAITPPKMTAMYLIRNTFSPAVSDAAGFWPTELRSSPQRVYLRKAQRTNANAKAAKTTTSRSSTTGLKSRAVWPIIRCPKKELNPEPRIASARPLTIWLHRRVIARKAWMQLITPPAMPATAKPRTGLSV